MRPTFVYREVNISDPLFVTSRHRYLYSVQLSPKSVLGNNGKDPDSRSSFSWKNLHGASEVIITATPRAICIAVFASVVCRILHVSFPLFRYYRHSNWRVRHFSYLFSTLSLFYVVIAVIVSVCCSQCCWFPSSSFCGLTSAALRSFYVLRPSGV